MTTEDVQALGSRLRRAREARGLSLQEIERKTRIRVKFLQAMEAGEFEVLPTPVQVRGFLRNYSLAVGLDPAEILAALEEAQTERKNNPIAKFFDRRKATKADEKSAKLAAQRAKDDRDVTRRVFRPIVPLPDEEPDDFSHPEPVAEEEEVEAPKTGPKRTMVPSRTASSAVQPRRTPLRFRLQRFFTPDVILFSLIVVVIIGGFVAVGVYVSNQMLNQAQNPQETELVGPTAAPTETPTPFANITFTPTQPPPLANFTDVQLVLIIEQRTLVIVYVDGEERYRAVATPGERLPFEADEIVEVQVSNGAGVRAILNQTDFGTLGGFGEATIRIFTPNDMLLPTATPDFSDDS